MTTALADFGVLTVTIMGFVFCLGLALKYCFGITGDDLKQVNYDEL